MGGVHGRRVLAGMVSAGAVGMAGCTESSPGPVPKVRVRNHSNQSVSVSLTIWNEDTGGVVEDDEFSLAADETRAYQQSDNFAHLLSGCSTHLA